MKFKRTSKSICSVYFNAFKPSVINSNTVFKFSADGAVTNIFEYPYAIAPARQRPIAADLPRPLAAVKATVVCKDRCDIASKNVITAFAYIYLHIHYINNNY